MAESTEIVVAILNGDLDDDITDIVAAIRERANKGEIRMCWKVTFDDLEITEENQTINEAQSVERQTKKAWGKYHPANSAAECAAIIVAALVERQGVDAVKAFEMLKDRKASDLVKSISDYAAVDPPKDGSGSDT